MTKAPVYTESGVQPFRKSLEHLKELCEGMRGFAPDEMVDELINAYVDLERDSMATVPISNTGRRIGYGVDKAKKAIACDTIISIARQIKAGKGW